VYSGDLGKKISYISFGAKSLLTSYINWETDSKYNIFNGKLVVFLKKGTA
jgi:hypothetical protein